MSTERERRLSGVSPRDERQQEGTPSGAGGNDARTKPGASASSSVEGEEDRPRYVISVAAQILHLHPQTLRLYEREGLVEPKRTGGKIRLYSERDIERVRCIMRLTTDLGVNLAGADIILSMRERLVEMRREMDAMRRQMDAELSEVERMFGAYLNEDR